MRNDLLRRARRDSHLSLRARGLLMLYCESGEVLSAAATARFCTEGRDAVRSAKNELIERGYVVSDRRQDSETGYWSSVYTLAPRVTENGFPVVGNPTLGFSGAISTNTSSKDKSHRKYPAAGAAEEVSEVIRGDWMGSGLGDEPASENPFADQPQSKKHANGGVTVTALPKRFSKEHKDWSASDLASEFSWRVAQIDKGLLAQSPSDKLRPALGKFIREGRLTPAEIFHAMEVFFEDPRNLNNLGEGAPLYKRFLGSFSSNQAEARRRAGTATRPMDDLVREAEQFSKAQKAKRRF